MGFIDSVANRLGFSRRPPLVNPAHYALWQPTKTEIPDTAPGWMMSTARGESWTMPDPARAQGQTALYRKLSWVQAAVGSVANFAATVPFEVKERRGGKVEDIDNHPFEVLLSRPNPLRSRLEFLVEVFTYFRVTGNAYIWRNQARQGAQPQEIWVLPSHQVTPKPDGRMFLSGYEYDPLDGSQPVLLEPWEIIHLRTFNPDSWFTGLSPLEALQKAAQGDLAQQGWNLDYFAKNNAKVAGALTFADNIENTNWNQLKTDLKEQHSGKVRSDLMLLRGVGQGAVHFLPMAMSQKDMEFLAGRQFTMEEIFRLFAPGLASLTAINATEANAKAGRDTFRELAVWPLLTAFAEKITNDLLPAYGNNLVGEFEDIRIRDKAAELAETQEYSKTHTINEVRERAGSEPLKDERGDLLVAQITPQSGGIQEIAPNPLAMGEGENSGGDKIPPSADEPDEGESDEEREKEIEAKAFKRWMKKPGRDLHKFKAHYLTHDELHQLAREADTEQPPFVWSTGEVTRDAYKALRLQLDPDDDEAERALSDAVVAHTADAIEKGLREWLREVFPTGTEAEIADWETRLLAGEARFRDVLTAALRQGTDLGVNVAFDQLGGLSIAFDYTLANTRARDWAAQYVGELITNIADNTRAAVRQSVATWIDTGQPLSALVGDLVPAFGRTRAKLIAGTEVTRAFAAGSDISYMTSGVVDEFEIGTSQDERVCPVCSGYAGRRFPVGSTTKPPFHPGCRCWIRPVVRDA